MSGFLRIAVLTGAVGIGVAASAVGVAAPSAVRQPAVRWEYAAVESIGRVSWVYNDRNTHLIESSAEQAQALNMLAAKMGAAKPQGSQMQPILDFLGAQGWELVSFESDRYIFKRPVQ